MYSGDGKMKSDRMLFEKKTMMKTSDEDWNRVTSMFENEDGFFTFEKVTKRLKRLLSSRENGKQGGAPKGNNNAKKKPETTKQNNLETTQINPPYIKESKSKVKDKENNKDRVPPATIEKRKEDFYNSLTEYVGEFGAKMVREFFDYWTEPNQAKTKMRFEMEKAWFTKRRLSTWKSRDTKPEEKSVFSRSDLNL